MVKLSPSHAEQQAEARITRWTSEYGLTTAEATELRSVLSRWPENEWTEGLQEGLDNIVAAREASLLPTITAADIATIQDAIASGLIHGPRTGG